MYTILFATTSKATKHGMANNVHSKSVQPKWLAPLQVKDHNTQQYSMLQYIHPLQHIIQSSLMSALDNLKLSLYT